MWQVVIQFQVSVDQLDHRELIDMEPTIRKAFNQVVKRWVKRMPNNTSLKSRVNKSRYVYGSAEDGDRLVFIVVIRGFQSITHINHIKLRLKSFSIDDTYTGHFASYEVQQIKHDNA